MLSVLGEEFRYGSTPPTVARPVPLQPSTIPRELDALPVMTSPVNVALGIDADPMQPVSSPVSPAPPEPAELLLRSGRNRHVGLSPTYRHDWLASVENSSTLSAGCWLTATNRS